MILNFLRLLLLVLLVIVIFIDIEIPLIINTPINQMIIAIVIIGIIVIFDEIIGFLLGLIFLIIYFKYYQKMFDNRNDLKEPLISTNNEQSSGEVYKPFKINDEIKPDTNGKTEQIGNHYIKRNEDENCVEMPYISKELLDKAQTNIYDINNYNLELGMGQNDSYGIQGLNSLSTHYHAFDKTIIENNYI